MEEITIDVLKKKAMEKISDKLEISNLTADDIYTLTRAIYELIEIKNEDVEK